MANIKINKKIFEKEIGELDEKMQERITLFGTPVESVDEENLELEIFPNRPDLLSYQGFKRSFLAFLGKKNSVGLKDYKLNKPLKDYKVIVEGSVESVRPFTACAIVKNIKLDDEKIKEIINIQEKLHFTVGRKRKKLAIGIYPLEKIKLPITYKALEPDKIKFIPLESDREMSGLQILQRHSAGRDYAHLLAGKQKFPIFVDNDNNILSMPPIINSHLTGKITESTTDIFIECSGFDFEILKKALNIIITTFLDMNSEVYQMTLQYKNKNNITPDLKPDKMKINLNNVNKLLGLNLNEKQLKTFLERMGYSYSNKTAIVPAWRTDILHEVDLIEDVAIAYGYENFIPEIPSVSTIGEEDMKETKKRKIAEILANVGLLEVSNFHLTKKEDQFAKMNLNEKESKLVEVEESKTDYTILRQNLSHYLLKILSENVDAEYPQRIFEIGTVFSNKSDQIEEKENLALALTPGNFTDIKQILEYMFKMIDAEIELKEPLNVNKCFIEGRAAEIVLKDTKKVIGQIGEIHPRILRNWRLKMPVGIFEINLGEK